MGKGGKRLYNTPEEEALVLATGPEADCSRRQGSFVIPSNQGSLNDALRGQCFHCPKCGKEQVIPFNLALNCTCGAVWTVSLGKSSNGDVAPVRIDRWR